TSTIRSQWEEAKGQGSSGASAGAQGGTTAAGGAGTQEEEQPTGLAATVNLIREALKADQEGRLEVCIEKDRQALKIDDSPRTRLHLASCEARSGKIVDALKNAQKSLELGIHRRDANVIRIARMRVNELLERIPHVTFVPPSGVADLKVTFDE